MTILVYILFDDNIKFSNKEVHLFYFTSKWHFTGHVESYISPCRILDMYNLYACAKLSFKILVQIGKRVEQAGFLQIIFHSYAYVFLRFWHKMVTLNIIFYIEFVIYDRKSR